jgi:glycosyltransferase involved in cell wall biosynthesis
LVELLKAARPFELLHCHTGRAHSLAAFTSLLQPKPLLVSRRVDFMPSNSWFNRWKYRRASKVVCVSNCIRKLFLKWGLPPNQLTVIYEAVPAESHPPRAEARRRLHQASPVPLAGLLVGSIGALVGHKDHATLLRAAARVVPRRPEVEFAIVGEGPLREHLVRLRRELKIEGKVHFLGFIDQAQRLLRAFDVFAMSSSMEGLGTIVLDAGLAGVPVVVTAAGGLPEITLNQQTGLVVPVGDASALAQAILRLLDDPALAVRLAEAARQRILADFSVPHMARQYAALYAEILGRALEHQPR